MWTYVELKPILFGLFFLGGMAIFARSLWRMARLLRLGRDYPQWSAEPVERFGDLIYYVFFQKRVVDRKFGWNHVIFFWGFLIITVGHSEFILRGIFPDFSLHFLGETLYSMLLRSQDVMALFVLFAVVAALFRRLVLRPHFIDYRSIDGFRILGMIAVVMITYFLGNGAAIHGGHPDVAAYERWLPISAVFSKFYEDVPRADAYGLWYEIFWWWHAAVLMVFLNYIPHSKHVHLIGAIPNIYLSDRSKPKSSLAPIDFDATENFGAGKFTEFPWKALLDTYACTECGRCDLHCPATNTGKPLKPQKVIHDLKANMEQNGDVLLAQRGIFELNPAPSDFDPPLALIAESEATAKPGQISPEVLWACTSCGACVEACPVLIDHVGTIMDMRRHLTLMQGDIKPELATTYKNVENNYNPWGIGADKRGAWAEALGLRFWTASDDAQKYEYLFWVGCAGSFDARAQKVVRAFARILDAAKVSYAVLGEREKCTGDPLRRTGNEYAFAALAQENVTTLNELGVTKIVTACPHCFNTLKNEYPAFGGEYEVLHHTQFISDLVETGRLVLDAEMQKRITFHDPCFLSRWNDEVESPRRSLASLRRLEIVEMKQSGRKSFCCGAGGGQMWMEEKIGTRVNYERTRQALETNPEAIAVACPFCMTMLEDGIKAANREESVQVLDIAELIDRASSSETTV